MRAGQTPNMGLFDQKYLSDAQIKGFDKYKVGLFLCVMVNWFQYTCIDSSPIAVYISHPFWNWFVNVSAV